ncbi:mechanosensitive ion channel family protein [Candidatus Saccharibacteria bacterium]|nr:mechanosensitive ion channel family protein [Candidatus Saccharibacteria bacterium]
MVSNILSGIVSSLFELQWFRQLCLSLLVIIIGFAIYKLLSFIISRHLTKSKFATGKKVETYLKMTKSLVRYTIIVVVAFMLLQINGVDISSMIAGVGIFSIVIGFAVQDILKDVIKGVVILTDGYYKVGDVIKFGDIIGKVEIIGIRTTKLLDLYTFNQVSISNRNIEQVEVISTMINIDIPLPYDLKAKKAESILDSIVNHIKELPAVENCEYRGINEFGDSSISYHIKVYTKPIDKVQSRRDALTIIFKDLESAGIAIPFNQLDIHQKSS